MISEALQYKLYQ